MDKISDPIDQARIIVKALQLEMSLHGYETALKDMKARNWPKDQKAQVLLNTYYARALQYYAVNYSWEIQQREKTISNEAKDLKTWTMQEIYQEANRSFLESFKQREYLGSLKKDEFREFIFPNSYPVGLKDSLRDSLSYLFVQLLNDSTGWTPAETNDLFQLNLKNLVHGKTDNIDLASEKVHPLLKISFILEDLRKWNEQHKNIQAALENKLSLYRILYTRFTQEQDRQFIRAELTKLLETSVQNPWFSMTAATLAEFWQQESAPEALNFALGFAQKGVARYPASLGAARCRDIIKRIKLPALQLVSMKVDGPENFSLGLKYKNTQKVYFRSYSFDIKDYLTHGKDYNLLPDYKVFRELLNKTPKYSWQTELAETSDYREHWHYVKPVVHENGFYITVASLKENFESQDNIIAGSMLTYGPLVLSVKNNYEKNVFEIETLNGPDGKLLPGINVSFYRRDYQKGHEFISSAQSDANGRIDFKDPGKIFSNNSSSYFFVAEHKGAVSFAEFYISQRGPQVETPFRAMIYSDRAIYRPLQKIQWKAVFYQAEKSPGKFHILPMHNTSVILRDINGQEVQKMNVVTDSFGAAWGEFTIPVGRSLGLWQIVTDHDSHSVSVEEYKRPTFELSWPEQKSAIRLNHLAEIIGEAKYYFGQALNKGKVKYKVQKSAQFPWWCFWGYFDYGYLQRTQIIKSGETTIQEDGRYIIGFTPEEDSRSNKKIDGITYNYTISVDVTDEGGETRSSSTSVRVAQVAVEANWSDINMRLENKAFEINLSRRLVTGGPAPGNGQWELVSLKEPDKTLMPAEIKAPGFLKALDSGLKLPGDLLQPRWGAQYNWKLIVRDWKEKSSLKSGAIPTDEKGNALLKLPGLKAGAYRLIYKSKDNFGENIHTETDFFVASSNYRPTLPLLFFSTATSAKVGETVSLWLPTGLKNQTVIFEVFQDNKLLERRYLKSDRDSAMIDWPIKEESRGGLGFSVRLLNDYQALKFSQSVFVPWDNKEISIETRTFRDRLIPGQKEKWTFNLKGPQGKKLKKASAQLLAYMYDRSLDLLAPHYSPSFLSLYPSRFGIFQPDYLLGQGWNAYFDHRLSYSNEYHPPNEDRLDFYASYGIGGPGQRNRGGGVYAMSKMSEGAIPSAPSEMVAESDSISDSPAPAALAKREVRTDKKSGQAENLLASAAPERETPPEKTLRSNFSETAFFLPNLTNSENGDIEINFEIPDSVTSYTLWLQAFTKDLMAGSMNKQIQTVKDLIVRPYLPRFLREADVGKIKVVVNNTSDKTLSGKLDIDISDESQKENLAAKFGLDEKKLTAIPFTIAAQKSFDYEVEMKVPAKVGLINFKAVAKAANLSDGELRQLPILPGRFHLAQSRFVTLNNKEQRVINFPEMAKPDDPSRISEKMVVQIDAQLFYSVLSALPYLVNEPYECIEQTLNRFLSTGILTSVFNQFPAIENMAKKISGRKTKLESFAEPDPNRKMLLEETPWLMQAKGGAEKEDELVNVLDSSIARQTRIDALTKLEKAQTSIGGFPWFSGGPPSPYITMYVLYGFSKALEFGVEVPKPLIRKAWDYMHQHYINEIVHTCMAHDGCWETITFLNYVLSNYPDDSYGNNVFTKNERKQMLNFSFKHWRDHSPYLKGYLALTLHRDKQNENAKIVWDSVMDSAKYTKDEGTNWMREDRSWLWYNDTVETHAFALRTLLELKSDNTKRDGLVEWLFLNKKLNHWKSTKATAEVIYSLAKYLTETKQLGKKEAVNIKIGNEKPIDLEFHPDEYTGKKNQIVLDGAKIKPTLMPITISKETPGLMFASATWHFSTEKLPEKAEGDFLNVERKYFLRQTVGQEMQLKPLSEGHSIKVGDEVEVQLSIRSKHAVDYVHLRDPRGAGFEPTSVNSQHKWDLGIYRYEEIRDSSTNFFFEHLPQGEYTFKYRIRASTAGQFQVSPATLQPMYAPEFAAYSSGQRLSISGSDVK